MPGSLVTAAERTDYDSPIAEVRSELMVQLSLRSVQLDVRAFNTDAIRFYEALGYLPVQHRLERKLA